MALYREQAVVLRTYRLGETDRIVALLTQGRGKVRAVAKGVRKPGSRFGALLEPSSHVALQLYEGRTLDTVTQALPLDAFRRLRLDLDALAATMTILEASDQVAQEGEECGGLYRMVVGALRTLDEEPSPMVAPAFLWKLLSSEGFHPLLEACIGCGAPGPLVALLPEAGGASCSACAPQRPGAESAAALAAIGMVLHGRLREALTEVSDPVVREVERLAVRAVEYHFERRLRSATMLAAR